MAFTTNVSAALNQRRYQGDTKKKKTQKTSKMAPPMTSGPRAVGVPRSKLTKSK